jgi:ATP-binding cassette subfamily F protein 3
MPDATEAQRRARLASFGLGIKNAETPAGDLSGGEKARLLFSLIGFHKPHLLVLDEPANHLDIDSRAELIRSLNNYEGAVVVISHDRNLLEAVVDRLWLVDSGKVEPFEGSLDDYRNLQLEKTKGDKKQKPKEENLRKRSRQDRAKSLREIAPLKRKTEDLEKKFEAAQAELSRIDARFVSEDLFTTNPDEAVKLGQLRSKTEALIESLELDWLAALEAYDLAREREGLD